MKRPTMTKLTAIVAISITISLAIPVVLGNLPPPTPVIPSECTAFLPNGWTSTPIINGKMNVQNDEDSGFVGYWALDNYVKSFVIWQNPTTSPNTFCALDAYNGRWHTFAGALSPQNGVTEALDQSGAERGGLILVFTASFLGPSSTKPLTGSIGTFDFGGTKSDILLGSYANHQVGDTSPTNFRSFYFTSVTDSTTFNEPFAFTYSQGSDVSYGTMWINANGGSFGDIATSAPGKITLNGIQKTSGAVSSSPYQITLVNFNAGTGSNRLLVVGIEANNNFVNSVTFGSTPLTQSVQSFYNNDAEFWYLTNPVGTANIVVTMSGSTSVVVGAYSLSGVDQTNPIPTTAKHHDTSISPSISITTQAPNSWVLDSPSIYGGVTLGSPSYAQSWDINIANAITGASSSTVQASPGSVTCKWTASGSEQWDDVAIEIQASGGP